MGDDDIATLVALRGRRAIWILDWDRRALRRAEADRHETDALIASPLRLRGDIVDVLEGFAIAHDHECLVRAAVREREQIGSLSNGVRKRAAGLPNDGRIEIVEEESEGDRKSVVEGR